MKRVVVDPISRIEGHLRVEIKVDEASGKVEGCIVFWYCLARYRTCC